MMRIIDWSCHNGGIRDGSLAAVYHIHKTEIS